MWIDEEAWRSELSAKPALADDPVVADWAARTWPFVIRRRGPDDRPSYMALGLPLPPSRGKRRIAFEVPQAAVLATRPPPSLAEIDDTAPVVWRDTFHALIALAEDNGIEARVFGSFAWGHLTGLDYVGDASDLDLLWPLTARTPDLLSRLVRIEQSAPGRLDGEIINKDGEAANWRELLGSTGDILVKTLTEVRLVDANDFLRSARDAA